MRVQDRTPERLGPYRLVRQLGAGGMGVVYLAEDEAGALVAVKALHPSMAEEANARRRLAREVETMRRVRSRYVAQVLGADLDGEPPYIVTRYVPGLTLEAVVGAGGPLTQGALARLARGLAEALAAVHAAGVVHRDLKPGNVMISDGEPVVIDFGIAHVPETTRLTMTGMFMGTPGYLAPEVIEGKESGPACDIHSWAATVAFAATGRPPFGTGPYEGVFYRIVHGQPDLDALPEPLRPMVMRALSRDPALRPSAAELAGWAAALDPDTLVPAPAARAAGGPALALGVLADPPDPQGAPPGRRIAPPSWPDATKPDLPSHTRPLPPMVQDDVRDLLPPVGYGSPADGARQAGGPAAFPPPAPGWPGRPAPGGTGAAPGCAEWAGQEPPAGAREDGRAPSSLARDGAGWQPGPGRPGPISPWSPLVVACVAALVAMALYAPLAGTAVALAVLVALRAAGITSRSLARRRVMTPAAAGGPALAIALYPVSVLRAVLVLAGLAPVAVLGFAISAAATVVAVPTHPLPRALAAGAATLVAVVGLGPGSLPGRAALAGALGALGRTGPRRVVVYAGVLAVTAWACLTAWSVPAVYWPVGDLHAQLVHLPALRTTLTDIRRSLLGLARRLGL